MPDDLMKHIRQVNIQHVEIKIIFQHFKKGDGFKFEKLQSENCV